mmetsp:Transcript_30579/g.89348  ORF Transcript_30579/g.89348 Transcript_30579/m.89348 type:complete len:202 (-) Transcript_30579:822-1427(-)
MMAPAMPAIAPATADIANPVGPTPTCTGSVKFPCELSRAIMALARRSNTRNFVIANGNSRDAMGVNPENKGLRSSFLISFNLNSASDTSGLGAGMTPVPPLTVLVDRVERFSARKSARTSVQPCALTFPILWTRIISKGVAAKLVMTHATAAAPRSTSSSPVPPPGPSSNIALVKNRRNNSVAPKPKEPKTSDARKVISAL